MVGGDALGEVGVVHSVAPALTAAALTDRPPIVHVATSLRPAARDFGVTARFLIIDRGTTTLGCLDVVGQV
jgi:hypothetical protein